MKTLNIIFEPTENFNTVKEICRQREREKVKTIENRVREQKVK